MDGSSCAPPPSPTSCATRRARRPQPRRSATGASGAPMPTAPRRPAGFVWLSADRLRVGTANTVADLAGGARPTSAVPPAADDPVAIVFTSGTTGIPKGAWYNHRNLLALAEIDGRRHAGGAPSSP